MNAFKKIVIFLSTLFFNFVVFCFIIFIPIYFFQHFETLGFLTIACFSSFWLFYVLAFINSIIFAKSYDNIFKKTLIDSPVTETNLMNFSPLPDKWVMEIKLIRASFYVGATLANFTTWKTLSFTQMRIAKEKAFIEKITPLTSFLSFSFAASFLLLIIFSSLYAFT